MTVVIIAVLALFVLIFLRKGNDYSDGVVRYSKEYRKRKDKELKKRGVAEYHMKKLETEEKIANFFDGLDKLMNGGDD
jgi:hypothetical protein